MLSIHSNPLGDLGTLDTGGMSVYIRELACELGRRGHRIDIFTRRQHKRGHQEHRLDENVELIYLDGPGNGNLTRSSLDTYLTSYQEALDAFQESHHLRYDLVHSHYWLSGQIGMLLQHRWRTPHITMFHTLGEVKNRVGAGSIESDLRIEKERELVAACDRILAPTETEKGHLIHDYAAPSQKVGVVPCGVDLDLFQPQEQLEARKKVGFEPTEHIILYVGRFDPIKGLDVLIQATALFKDHKEIKLVVIGGDGRESFEFNKVKSQIQEHGLGDQVILIGRIHQECLPLYYNAANVLVIPSRYESFGLVALEALACGLPVVSTKTGIMEELANQHQVGHRVCKPDPVLLAREIQRTMDAPVSFSVEQIRQSIVRYSWSNVADAVLCEYEVTMDNSKTQENRVDPTSRHTRADSAS